MTFSATGPPGKRGGPVITPGPSNVEDATAYIAGLTIRRAADNALEARSRWST